MPVFFALLLCFRLLVKDWQEATGPSLTKYIAEGFELSVFSGDIDGAMLILSSYMIVCALEQS